MTPEQREAAIERMCHGMSRGLVSPPYHRLTLSDANAALDALLGEFVVIPKDDVFEEFVAAYGDGTIELRFRPPTLTRSRHHTHTRLATRWKSITTEAPAS